MKITVRRFMVDYLKDFAIITIADERGNIIYEGDVISCQRSITAGLYVKSIEGIGSLNDIIIVAESIDPA